MFGKEGPAERRARRFGLRFIGAVAMTVAASAALAAPIHTVHPTATFGLFAGESTLGISPTHNAGDTFYKYSYQIPSGAALSDTLPFRVCLDDDTPGNDGLGNPVPWTDQVAVDNISGAFSADVSASGSPWFFSSSDPVIAGNPPAAGDPACQSGTIIINVPSGVLVVDPLNPTVPVGYTTNAIFKTQNRSPDTGPTSLQDSFGLEFKIQIFVEAEPVQNVVSCYITDSDGNFLLKADGITPASTSGETDGTFAIVKNAKGKAVATNPGQFYYNFLWKNTSAAPVTVGVSLADTNVNPNGSQAIHWLTFLTSTFDGVTNTNFGDVNEGNPAGTTGPISNIAVPGLSTLYVTQHLEWAGLGKPAPTSPVTFTVQGTVSPTGDTCTAGAIGSVQ